MLNHHFSHELPHLSPLPSELAGKPTTSGGGDAQIYSDSYEWILMVCIYIYIVYIIYIHTYDAMYLYRDDDNMCICIYIYMYNDIQIS